MRHALDLFSLQGRVTRRHYIAAGIVLFTIKYWLDFAVAHAFGRPWSLLYYLSPRISPLLVDRPSDPYWLTLLAVALPFIWAGVSLSARRLRDMGLNPLWAGLFLLPFLHFAFFLVLAVAPPRQAPEPTPPASPYREPPPAAPGKTPSLLDRAIPRQVTLAFVVSLLINLLLGTIALLVTTQVRDGLGVGLFVGVPFGIGFLTAFLLNYWRTITLGLAIGYSCITLAVGLALLFALRWEGAACLLMASPILVGLCLLGALLGWAATRTRLPAAAGVLIAPLVLLCDLGRPAAPPAPLRVVTEVTISAPAERVWQNVVAFPPIDAPPAPIFALVAMPLEARIEGTGGVGARRYCRFTSGTFLEPIEVWRPGQELRFGVSAQPPGLDGLLEVTRGQFLLRPNPDGTTTLRGTTWYRLRVRPTAYWSLWTQRFIRAIHERVLAHIKQRSERPELPRAAAPAALPAWMAAANATCRCTVHATSE
ncbi:MAG TPA: DUF805 domain-containing protein [Polyangia bacterium]|nr:DUF805 domain-containing protein [Polyangia bacterium]